MLVKMVIDYSFKIVLMMSICSVGLAIEDPCPSYNIPVVDICQPSFATENITETGENFDSVLIRVDTHTDNCTCHARVINIDKLLLVYIQPFHNSAPHFPNCGLEVIIVDTSTPTMSCTSGHLASSTNLGDDKSITFTTRVIGGNFTKGYCIQIHKAYQTGISGILQVSCGSYKSEVKSTTDSNTKVKFTPGTGDYDKMSTTYIAVGSAIGGIVLIMIIAIVILTKKRHQKRLKSNCLQSDPPNPDDTDYGLQYNTMYVGSDTPQPNGATDYATIADTMSTAKSEQDSSNKYTDQTVSVDEINVENNIEIGTYHQYAVVDKNKGEFNVQDSNNSHEYAVVNKVRKPSTS